MRAAIDTNVLAYAEGVGDARRCNAARTLFENLPGDLVLLPAQTLGELFRVLTGKSGRAPDAARTAILGWSDSFEIMDSSWTAFQTALDLCVDHRLQIWDALILAVSAEHGCRLLLTEDLQTGFTWRGVTVVDPFSEPEHPLLKALLERD